MASSKAIPITLLVVVSPKKFPFHHQAVSDKFFCKIIGHHWFPTKSDISLLYFSFLTVNFIFECRSRHFEHIRCFFKPISSLLTSFMASPFSFCPTFYTSFGPSTTQNSELLENRRDEVLSQISSRTILGLHVGTI